MTNLTNSQYANLTEAAQLYSYQAPSLIAWLITCALAIVCNIIMIIVVCKNKEFHTKSHFVVISLCVSEIVEVLAWDIQAIKRLIIYANNLDEVIGQWSCIWQ